MNLVKLAGSQAELETISNQQYRSRTISSDRKAAARNYYSSTEHGRSIVRGGPQDEQGSTTDYYVHLVAREIESWMAQQKDGRGKKSLGYEWLTAFVEAFLITRSEHPEYAGPPLETLAVIGIKSVVDGFGSSESHWPFASAIVQRIGEAVELQYIDACALWGAGAEEYERVSERWNRKNQSGSNKVTNIRMGQADLIDRAGFERDGLKFPRGAKASIGVAILDCIARVGLCSRYDAPRDGKERPPVMVKPNSDLVGDAYLAFIDDLVGGRMRSYPMIEAPQQWQHLDTPGIHNSTGGFHNQRYRESHPLVRSRWGDNGTVPSQLAIDLVNLLGSVAYTPDLDTAEAYEFAVKSRLDIDGINPLPLQTIADLDAQGRRNKLDIERDGYLLIKGQKVMPDRSNAIWRNYMKERRLQYDAAVESLKKFVRTRITLLSAKTVADAVFKRVFFSWSLDYRLRAYPVQSTLTPQSSAPEKVSMRFADGEPITTDQQREEIYIAIGAAFLGRRYTAAERKLMGDEELRFGRSDSELSNWAKEHVEEILDALDDNRSRPGYEPGSDIKVLMDLDADEPWDALALMNGYRRSFKQGQPWDVGISIDASQSGIQLLASALRDEEAMVATNVLRPTIEDLGPVDGYQAVLKKAYQLATATEEEAEQMGADPAWMSRHLLTPTIAEVVVKILSHPKGRSVAKPVSMPLIYGGTVWSMLGPVREAIAGKLGFDLRKEFVEDGDDAFHSRNQVVTETTCYLHQATALTYPRVVKALAWLTALARKSIARQLAEAEEQGIEDFMPKLEWRLSDGSVCSYWETKLDSPQIKTLEFGRFRCPVDVGSEPDVGAMVRALAPGWTHSLDALLLRTALRGWTAGPVATVHDCIRVLPSALPELRKRLQEAMEEVIEANPIHALAEQMGVPLEELPPLEMGDADLSGVRRGKYLFHT